MKFKKYIIKFLSNYLILTSLFQCSSKNDNLNNNYDDINRLMRDTNDIIERINRMNREKTDELREKVNKKMEQYLALRERKFAPVGEDGMTKYEREYYEKNYKKILDDGLQKISNAKNTNELCDICRKYKDEICQLIDSAQICKLGLSDDHIKTYTDTKLNAAFIKRHNEIQLKIPLIAISIVTFAVAGAEAHGYWKKKHPEI